MKIMKISRELIFLKDKNQIIAKWLDNREDDVVLIESVKDCTILNNGQDCRYITNKAMDPWTHYIMVHPNGCIEFEKRENNNGGE